MTKSIIEVDDITKSFGDVHALTGVNLHVQEGTVFGLLGPNGAGKTTTVRVLATLLRPDSGTARVDGYDVTEDPNKVRATIGLAGQYAAVDENLTGLENLELVGRLYHLPKREAKQRAVEILDRFELGFAAKRVAKTYSGGMRRRLDLAASLVGRPRVLFLDEPTTGLDPRSRIGLWEVIEGLVDDGTTVLLTTQYLDEADRLADKIAVIDHGTVIDQGTASELKSHTGGNVIDLHLEDPGRCGEAVGLLTACCVSDPEVDEANGHIVAGLDGGGAALVNVVDVLSGAGILLADLALRQPTLDDVFMTLTGHGAEEPAGDEEALAEGGFDPAESGPMEMQR